MKLRMYVADFFNLFHPIVDDKEMYLARKENREPIPFTYGFKITLVGADTLTPEEMEKMKLFLEENMYIDVTFDKCEENIDDGQENDHL